MAQMERELKAERTAAGRAATKARGRTGGRPRTDPDKLEQARILYLHANKTAANVCRTVGIGRRTLFSYLAQVRGQKEGKLRMKPHNINALFASAKILRVSLPMALRANTRGCGSCLQLNVSSWLVRTVALSTAFLISVA